MDNEWKNSLRERFSDYSAPVPEGLWEGIEQGISEKPRRKMLPVWLISGAAVAAAAALVVFLHPGKSSVQPDLQKGNLAAVVKTEAEPDETVVVDTTSAEETPVPAGVSKSVPFAVVSRQTLLSEAEPAPSVPVDEDLVPDAVHKIVATPETPVTEVEEVKEMPDQFGHDEPVVSGKDEPVVTERKESEITVAEYLKDRVPSLAIGRPRKRFSIGAYGNGGQASSEQMKGYGMNRTNEYLTRATGGAGKKDVGGVMRMLSANRASTFEAHHSAPLRVGVTASYGLTRHLSLVSGLNWTYLNSEFEETAGAIRTVTGQDLGYLGIPLRLEAGANVWKGLWVYAGAGGMMEKGLLSKSSMSTMVDGQMAESKDNPKPDMGGLLWSVGANAGAEYRFSPHFGLYFTPGVEYHFDNGAEVRSAYTEKPLHWNLNLGARFHFGN